MELQEDEKQCIVRNFVICTPHQIFLCHRNKEHEMGWECDADGVDINAYRLFVGKPERRRSLGRPRRRC
jgi:hypothetical protein